MGGEGGDEGRGWAGGFEFVRRGFVRFRKKKARNLRLIGCTQVWTALCFCDISRAGSSSNRDHLKAALSINDGAPGLKQ